MNTLFPRITIEPGKCGGQAPRDLAPSWGGAWIYAQGRFTRELSKLGKSDLVRFMAGG